MQFLELEVGSWHTLIKIGIPLQDYACHRVLKIVFDQLKVKLPANQLDIGLKFFFINFASDFSTNTLLHPFHQSELAVYLTRNQLVSIMLF